MPMVCHHTLPVCKAVKLNDCKISGQELGLFLSSIPNTAIKLLIVIICADTFGICSEPSAALLRSRTHYTNVFTLAKGMLKNKSGWR